MTSISIRDWISKNGVEYMPIKDPEDIQMRLPKMYRTEDMWIWEEYIKYFKNGGTTIKTSPQYVGITKNLKCCSDGGVMHEYGYITGFEGGYDHRIASHFHNPCVNLVDHWSGINYWHWITTSLARLYMVQKINGFHCRNYFYIVNSLKNGFVRDSLARFGISPEQCIETPEGTGTLCDNLILPSKLYDVDNDAIRYLREFLRQPTSNSKRKIYISRDATRKILNESQVMEVLSKRGFEKVRCESISFSDQVSLFSDASVIVGPHGAGMTNILFAQDNAKVMEIRNRTYHGPCYYQLCDKLGFDYYNLYGTGHEIKSFRESSSDLYGNITVDMVNLINTLDMMDV